MQNSLYDIKRTPFEKLFLSLRGKIIIFACTVTLLASITIGVFFYTEISKSSTRFQIAELTSQSKLISPLLLSAFQELHSDVSLLSKVPPVNGLIRSSRNNNIDPFDGSTTDQWRTRLETVFLSMLEAKPNYSQIRYIGIADNGKELVRIDRKNGQAVIIPPENLQSKGDEFYFKDVLNLPHDEVYYSPVSLNREHGEIQTPFLPVIRTIIPVYDGNDKIFGMIVINAAYEKVLGSFMRGLDINKHLYVINQSGDYINHNPDRKNATFNFRALDKLANENSILNNIFSTPDNNGVIYGQENNKEHIAYFQKNYFNPSNTDQYLITAVTISKDILLAPSYKAEKNALILIGAIVIIVSLCAAFFSSLLTKPLVSMVSEIRSHSDDIDNISLPTRLRGEIGELAIAFTTLIDTRIKTEKQLKQSNEELEEFAYRTSHDLRSPLVSSIGLLDIAQKSIRDNKNDIALKSLEHISNSMKKLEQLVQDILSLTQTKNIDEKSQNVDLSKEVNSTLEKLTHMENFDRLTISTHMEFSKPIVTKKMCLTLIIENLISNAIKYQDVKKENASLTIKSYELDGNFVFEVEDNGIGIPEGQENKLFTMFSRFHPKTSFGSGLGLYMMKKNATKLNGKVIYEKPNEGCRFKLEIPLSEV